MNGWLVSSNFLCITIFASSFFCTINGGISSEWNYSCAADCAQNENWLDAQQRMSSLLVDDPDSPNLLYDIGVVAYRMKEFEKAEAYFDQTTQCNTDCDILKKQAYFNLGNTKVALSKLPEAVESYETVLKIDPDDERAQHNLEQVKKLLQQQEKQKEQQNDQQQQQQSRQNGDSQDQRQENDQPQKNNNNQKSKSEDRKDKQDNQQQSQDQQDDAKSGNSQNQEKKLGANEEVDQSSNEQDEGNKKNNSGDESDNNKSSQEHEQLRNHNSSSQEHSEQQRNQQSRDSDFQNTQEDQKEQAVQEGKIEGECQDLQEKQKKEFAQKFSPHEQWMMQVLQQRDQADEKANKRVVKATIDKQLAGKNGQNCW